MTIEDQLRAALRRESPPSGFAAKVIAKANSRRLPRWIWRRPMTLALAVAITLAAVIPPAVKDYRRRQQERALDAEAQLLTALSITQTQLRRVSDQIQKNTRPIP